MYFLGLGFLMVLVNTKTGEAHTQSLVTGHLSQYEVPHLHKSWALFSKKIAAPLFTSQGVGNMEHLLEDQAAHIQCIYVGLEILARVLDFFFWSSTPDLMQLVRLCHKGEVPLHKLTHICARTTTGGNTCIPPLSVSHLNTICGIFWITDGLWFLREFLLPRTRCLKHCLWQHLLVHVCSIIVQYTDMCLGFNSNFMCMHNSVP